MQAKVQRWGNSLAVRIPKAFAMQSRLAANSPIVLSIEGDTITLRPLEEGTKRYTLDELLESMTSKHAHGEVSFGEPVGKETL